MKLTNPITVGEVKEVDRIEIISVEQHSESKSLNVKIGMYSGDEKVEEKSLSFRDVPEREETFTEFVEPQSNDIEFDREIISCVVSDVGSNNEVIPSTINGNVIHLDVESLPKKVRIYGKKRIPAVTDYSDICSDLFQINQDVLWNKILEKIGAQ